VRSPEVCNGLYIMLISQAVNSVTLSIALFVALR